MEAELDRDDAADADLMREEQETEGEFSKDLDVMEKEVLQQQEQQQQQQEEEEGEEDDEVEQEQQLEDDGLLLLVEESRAGVRGRRDKHLNLRGFASQVDVLKGVRASFEEEMAEARKKGVEKAELVRQETRKRVRALEKEASGKKEGGSAWESFFVQFIAAAAAACIIRIWDPCCQWSDGG